MHGRTNIKFSILPDTSNVRFRTRVLSEQTLIAACVELKGRVWRARSERKWEENIKVLAQ